MRARGRDRPRGGAGLRRGAGPDVDIAADGEVLVASDAAAWQVGAFAGGDGAVIALGTGAAVVARDRGVVTRLDGLGLLLGDVGGGAWIGLQALRRAARTDGGPVHAAAIARFGPAAGWSRLLGAADLAPRLAALVPDVVPPPGPADPTLSRCWTQRPPACWRRSTRCARSCRTASSAASPRCSPRAWPRPRRTGSGPTPRGDVTDGLRLLLVDAGPYVDETYRAGAR